MAANTNEYPHLSDWSMAEPEGPKHRRSCCCDPIRLTELNHNQSSDNLTTELKSSQKLGACCSTMQPCLVGLVVGVVIASVVLSAVLIVWLTPIQKTGVIITNEIPPGTILQFGGNLSSLVGSTHRWLRCDGSEVSRTTYRDLFAVLGVMYGAGNGSDTFNLPDFRARFPLGSNGSNSSQLTTGGASSHVMTISEMPAHSHDQGTLQTLLSGQHTHSYIDPGHNHAGLTGPGPFSGGSFGMIVGGGAGNDGGTHSHTIPVGATGIAIQSNGDHTHTVQGMTGPQGGSQPIDTMPPYQAIHYIIRA